MFLFFHNFARSFSAFTGFNRTGFARSWLRPVVVTFTLLTLTSLSVSVRADNLLIVGDSLTAGYGVPAAQHWPGLLQKKLKENGTSQTVIAAGVSGDTTSGGLRRLPGLIEQYDPAQVIIFLGGNDGLRGTPVKLIRKNLADMIEMSKASGAEVYLFSMQIPANYGARYTRSFADMYPALAKEHKVTLIPFFPAELTSQPEMIQADGIHPTGKAQPFIAEHILPYVSR